MLAVLDCRFSSPLWMLSMVLGWKWRKIDNLGDQRADPQDCILGGRCSKTGNSVAGVIRVIPSNVGCADHPQYANEKNEQ